MGQDRPRRRPGPVGKKPNRPATGRPGKRNRDDRSQIGWRTQLVSLHEVPCRIRADLAGRTNPISRTALHPTVLCPKAGIARDCVAQAACQLVVEPGAEERGVSRNQIRRNKATGAGLACCKVDLDRTLRRIQRPCSCCANATWSASGRRVCSRPSRRAVRSAHASVPNGRSRSSRNVRGRETGAREVI